MMKHVKTAGCLALSALFFCACAQAQPAPSSSSATRASEPILSSAVSAVYSPGPVLELGDDPFSFRTELAGVVYAFPCPATWFFAGGWSTGASHEEPFAPGDTAEVPFEHSGGLLTLRLANLTDVPLPLEECSILGFSSDITAPAATLPGGIALGSARALVTELCGVPDGGYEAMETRLLRYTVSRDTWLEFAFGDAGTLNKITLCCREAAPAPPAEADLPAEVLAYQPPTVHTGGWPSYTVNYAGTLYRLPAPVAAFLQNGWWIEDTGSVEAGGWVSGVSLRKGAQTLQTTLYNYSGNAQPYTGCFVAVVRSGQATAQVPLELAGGLNERSTTEKVTAVLGPPHETFYYSSLRYLYYHDGEAGRLVFIFNLDDLSPFGIELWHLEP